MIDQSKIGNSSQIIFVALFSGRQVHISALCVLPTSAKLMLGQNHFAHPRKWHVLTLLYPV
jgi:hypothetical protein